MGKDEKVKDEELSPDQGDNFQEIDMNVETKAAPSTAAAVGPPIVALLEPALETVNTHAAEEPEREVGGILVGTVIEEESDRPIVIVQAAIRGYAMKQTPGTVTFTHDTWSAINAIKDRDYPDLKIVGWYHSHPGHGVFLSEYDLFIHQNFFPAPWQIALVNDPLAKKWGCFVWHAGRLQQADPVRLLKVSWPKSESEAKREHFFVNGSALEETAQRPQMSILSAAGPEAQAVLQKRGQSRGILVALAILAILGAVVCGIALFLYGQIGILRQQVDLLCAQTSNISREIVVLRDALPAVVSPAKPAAQEQSPAGSSEAASGGSAEKSTGKREQQGQVKDAAKGESAPLDGGNEGPRPKAMGRETDR